MSGPVILGAPGERFRAVPALEGRVAAGFAGVASALGLAGRAVQADPEGPLLGVADGNRSAVFPDLTVEKGDRRWALSVKGLGARAAMYGESPLGSSRDDAPGAGRWFAAEAWFGEAPWGAQGGEGAATALAVTEAAASIDGFAICPVFAVVALPEEALDGARDRWWYRRYRGPFLQEHRLVPSDVRLFHATDHTLASDPDAVLDAFGVRAPEEFDAFAERFLRTGVAALTLYARSLREGPHGPEGLVYQHVWLDKDGILAPDGSICFADLEGLDWCPAGPGRPVHAIVRRQFDDNAYELLYALDALLRAGERRFGRPRTVRERRADTAARMELALWDDPFVRCEVAGGSAALLVRPPAGEPVRLLAIDLEA